MSYTPDQIVEHRRRWVEALRSGEYKQGIGLLHRVSAEDGEPDTFCCLGVACDLAQRDGVPMAVSTADEVGPGHGIRYDQASAYLPPAVAEWLGLYDREDNPSVGDGLARRDLASLNDGGYDFGRIAALIEAEYLAEPAVV